MTASSKNLSVDSGMIRNQIHLHGLLNKSKEKNSILFRLLHINALFPDLVEEDGYHSADRFSGLGLVSVVQIDHFTEVGRFDILDFQ